MNWYKKAQSEININDIIKAIDTLILNNEEIITEEDIAEAFARNNSTDEYMRKSAQSINERGPSPNDVEAISILRNYFTGGLEPNQIAKELGINIETVREVIDSTLKNEFWEKNLKNVEKKMQEDTRFKITTESVANVLNIHPKYVLKVLKENNSGLKDLAYRRKKILEDKIVQLVDGQPPFAKYQDVATAFKSKYGYSVNMSAIRRAMLFRNKKTSKNKRENLIFTAFKTYLQDHMRGSIDTYMTNRKPGGDERRELSKFIDKFIDSYGEYFGFTSSTDKQVLKNLFTMKLRLRESVNTQKELGQFYNKYLDENNQNKIIDLIEKGYNLEQIALNVGINIDDLQKFYQLYMTEKGTNNNELV